MFKGRPKPTHYRGDYHVRSRAVVAAAYADPNTRCWRCKKRLFECRSHRNGKLPRWTAGHVHDGEVGGLLLPECSPCNSSAGARLANRRSRRIEPRRTDLSW